MRVNRQLSDRVRRKGGVQIDAMMLPSFLDVYLCFGLLSVSHWALVGALRLCGVKLGRIPH